MVELGATRPEHRAAIRPSLCGKVAIVTGASRGIGQAVALTLAEAGVKVVVTARSVERLRETEERIRREGGTAHCVALDVRKVEDSDRLVEETLATYGSIDILVNNAGVVPPLKRADRITPEEWREIVDTDLTGTFLCTQRVGKQMMRQRGGVVVNIASMSGESVLPGAAPYVSAKAGVIALTKVLAVEWAPSGIRVNCVAPGWTATDPTLPLQEKKGPYYQWIMDRTPMKRFGTAEEVASVVEFLASDAASFITGATIMVDGGWSAW